MEASGEMRLGETSSASGVVSRRVYGSLIVPLVIYLIAIFATLAFSNTLAAVLLPELPEDVAAPTVVVLVIVVAFFSFVGWRRRVAVTGWTKRGVPLVSRATFRLTPDALEIEAVDWLSRYAWSAVSELVPSRDHWIYIVSGLAFAMPKRFFPDVDAERAFIRASLASMTAEARERSDKAGKFVGVWA